MNSVSLVALGHAIMNKVPEIESWVRGLDVEHRKLSDDNKRKLQEWLDWVYHRNNELRLAALQDPNDTIIREGPRKLDKLECLIRSELKKDDDLNAGGRN
ncbi:hypothetical protein F4815DRAFT_450590 [Daldinia loculata]|nr:hypothetical protein F4815DRAFT_450590 [Daldinia loculata]